MAIKETSGHILEIGDRVKMNIPKIGKGGYGWSRIYSVW